MGGNNPRLRKSQELANGAGVPEGSAPASAPTPVAPAVASEPAAPTPADSGPVAAAPGLKRSRTRGKRPSVANSGRVVDAGVSGALADAVSVDLDVTDAEDAERAAAALERQALARQERIERAEQDERKRRRRRIVRRVLLGFLFTVLLVFAGLLAAFGIFRWQTYDDAADIQGTWYHEDTTMPITITADEIVLTDDVAYRYVLDPEAKTILFRFGNMEGGGRYRFSLDRTELVITDGEFDWWANFWDDALWTAQSLLAEHVFSTEVPLSDGSPHETVFTR